MIVYFDTSALVKVLVREEGTAAAREIWTAAQAVVATPLVEVEARAALAAAQRGCRLSPSSHRTVKQALSELLAEVTLVPVTSELTSRAADLAESEALRGYHAVHLAAALTVADVLASADRPLGRAALARGLQVADPLGP